MNDSNSSKSTSNRGYHVKGSKSFQLSSSSPAAAVQKLNANRHKRTNTFDSRADSSSSASRSSSSAASSTMLHPLEVALKPSPPASPAPSSSIAYRNNRILCTTLSSPPSPCPFPKLHSSNYGISSSSSLAYSYSPSTPGRYPPAPGLPTISIQGGSSINNSPAPSSPASSQVRLLTVSPVSSCSSPNPSSASLLPPLSPGSSCSYSSARSRTSSVSSSSNSSIGYPTNGASIESLSANGSVFLHVNKNNRSNNSSSSIQKKFRSNQLQNPTTSEIEVEVFPYQEQQQQPSLLPHNHKVVDDHNTYHITNDGHDDDEYNSTNNNNDCAVVECECDEELNNNNNNKDESTTNSDSTNSTSSSKTIYFERLYYRGRNIASMSSYEYFHLLSDYEFPPRAHKAKSLPTSPIATRYALPKQAPPGPPPAPLQQWQLDPSSSPPMQSRRTQSPRTTTTKTPPPHHQQQQQQAHTPSQTKSSPSSCKVPFPHTILATLTRKFKAQPQQPLELKT